MSINNSYKNIQDIWIMRLNILHYYKKMIELIIH